VTITALIPYRELYRVVDSFVVFFWWAKRCWWT